MATKITDKSKKCKVDLHVDGFSVHEKKSQDENYILDLLKGLLFFHVKNNVDSSLKQGDILKIISNSDHVRFGVASVEKVDDNILLISFVADKEKDDFKASKISHYYGTGIIDKKSGWVKNINLVQNLKIGDKKYIYEISLVKNK